VPAGGQSASETAYFILNQRQADEGQATYDDVEGSIYHWTSMSSGAPKQLAELGTGARFAYYRPGIASDGTAQTYFGHGRIVRVTELEAERHGRKQFKAELADFQPFSNLVPLAEGPKRQAQRSIERVSKADFEALVNAGHALEPEKLTPDALKELAETSGLLLDDVIYGTLIAAVNSGKHVILTGPPGTAKTTLAQLLGELARDAGHCKGHVLTTATADWTTYETIGGLRPQTNGDLQFEEGHFLASIRANEWLVIDELNRSNIDRAFGQLFTVLSGQAVVLPYRRPGQANPLALVPAKAEPPTQAADVLRIPKTWRVIATMNVFDKSLLFELSYALMRRFAFIEIPSPRDQDFEMLIVAAAGDVPEAASVAMKLLALRKVKDLGPAVYIDIAKYCRERLQDQAVASPQLYFEAFYSYLLPQFEGISDDGGRKLFRLLRIGVGTAATPRLIRVLNDVLGLELKAGPTSSDVASTDDAELDDAEHPEDPALLP
jgi:MoxR-like ATPase